MECAVYGLEQICTQETGISLIFQTFLLKIGLEASWMVNCLLEEVNFHKPCQLSRRASQSQLSGSNLNIWFSMHLDLNSLSKIGLKSQKNSWQKQIILFLSAMLTDLVKGLQTYSKNQTKLTKSEVKALCLDSLKLIIKIKDQKIYKK